MGGQLTERQNLPLAGGGNRLEWREVGGHCRKHLDLPNTLSVWDTKVFIPQSFSVAEALWKGGNETSGLSRFSDYMLIPPCLE